VERDSRRRMMWSGRPAQSVRGNDTRLEIAESRVTQMAKFSVPVSWISYGRRWILLTLNHHLLLTQETAGHRFSCHWLRANRLRAISHGGSALGFRVLKNKCTLSSGMHARQVRDTQNTSMADQRADQPAW
jgi:hypothetical protein